MTCQNCTIQVGSRYSYAVRMGLRVEPRIAVLCDTCRDGLLNLGMDLREERRTDPRRRRFPPRDLTGWITPGPSIA